MPGTSTSGAEVTDIAQHGLWVLVAGRELFLPFEEFPWFRQASVDAVLKVEFNPPDHLHWPDLDVDLSIDSIEHPERYPLTAMARDDA
jgi:hypothetical protein